MKKLALTVSNILNYRLHNVTLPPALYYEHVNFIFMDLMITTHKGSHLDGLLTL